MDSMQKMMSSSANLHKSLGIMNEHYSALQKFAQKYPNLQDAYKDATTLQRAGNHLLTMQGINKNILGLQSVFLQNDNWRKTLSLIQDEMDKFHRQVEIRVKGIISEQQKISQDMIRSAIGIANQQTSFELEHAMKIIRDYTPLEIIRQRDFLSQITKQSPLINSIQSQMPKIEPIWESSSVLAKIATTPMLDSVLPVAMDSFNFSSELDKLALQEQQRIVDILEQINLDEKIDEEIDSDIQPYFSILLKSLQKFFKNNAFDIATIIGNTETFISDISEQSFSHPIFDITFIICLAIILSKFSIHDDDKASK